MSHRQNTLGSLFSIIIASLTIVSCNSSDGPVDPGGNANNTGGPPVDPRAVQTKIYEAYNAPQFIDESAKSGTSLCAQAVFVASIETGGRELVTTGTLTESAPKSNVFTYTSSPADRLRLVYADGTIIEFVVSSFDGDFSVDAERFLERNHQLAFTMKQAGVADIEITSQLSNRRTQRTLRGSFTYEKVLYNADVTINETSSFEIFGTDSERKSNSTIRGAISAPGLSITVDETNSYYSSFSGNRSEELTRTINTSWTAGSDRYAIVDGNLEQTLFNDVPSLIDASGTITLNGAAAGRLSGRIERNQIKVRADVNGVVVELGTF